MRIGEIAMANVAPLASQVLKVTFNQSYGAANNIMNRLFYTFTGTLDTSTANQLASHMGTVWNTDFAPFLSTTYELISVQVTDLGSASGTQVDLPTNWFGTEAAADYLPATTCMCLTAIIPRRYRGGKPRWYQTGHHQVSLADNQHFTTTAIGNFEAAINALASGAKGQVTNGGTVTNNVNLSLVEGYTWVPYTTSSGKTNYRKDPIYRNSAVTDVISVWTANARVSSQRKRGVN